MALLETPRLELRRLAENDAPFVLVLLNEPSFLANIGDRGVRTLDGARGYIAQGPMAIIPPRPAGSIMMARAPVAR